jgi:hypothetical protein
MKKSILISLMLAISLLGLLTTCNKKKQSACEEASSDCEYKPIASTMKGFLFGSNSYWVYKNDSLNSYDSIFIISTETGCEVLDIYLGYCVKADYYKMNYPGKWNADNYYDMIESSILGRNGHPLSLDFSYQKGWILYDGREFVFIDSLKVGENTFYHVQKSDGAYNIYSDVTVYTAKNVGIVKKIINTNPKQVWNLVRWKINK